MMRAGYDVDWEEDTLLSLGLLGSHYASFQSLEINVEGITSATFLRHFNNLIKLEMNVNKLQDVHGLGALGSLEELSIKDNILVSIDGIESLHSLKSLRLDSNKLCDLSPLNGLSSLTSLSANNNLLEIMPSLDIPALQRLELYQNNLVMIPTESMQGLPSLMHLDIGRNKLEYIDGNALTQCLNLSTLILSQNSLHAVPAPLYLPHLRNLWLSGNKISDLSMWAPRLQPQGMFTCNSEFEKAFGNAKSFKEIYDHRQHLHWPVFLPMLEKLRLQDNQIQCVDCGSLSGMPSLRELDVSFNALQTVNSLHGLVGLGGESLKILHLQDNPISKDVVTNQHNVNVQDEHERVESLREFLQFACPALTTMSGKPFQFEGVGEDSYEGSGVQGLIAQERSSNTSTADRHRDAASILAAYRRTGTWASVALAASHMYNGNALPSKIVCDTHKFKLRMSQAVDKHTSEDDSEIFQGLRRCEHAFLCDRSEHVKTMMKLIATFSTEQNALRLREKHYRGSIDGCKVADGSNDPSSVEAKRKKYWASAIVHFLEDQHDQLRAFARTKATNTSEIQKQDHVDEDDHVPNRLYSTLQLTEEMHFQDDDSINHQGPTSIGIAGDMQCLHQAHEDLHTSEVGSSMAHSASAYDIVGAATRLQRVYRGSRVRKQLKLALASAKYVDDELEDIMNDDDMDELNEFLNMNFSLDAEISDFQGDGCAAGKGAIEPGAADLRTYSESRDDDRSERSDRTSISRTPSIVYGDHRRKRKESREALPSVGITAHREVSLDRVRTSTADTDADSVRSELLSEASAHGTRDAKRFSSHDHAPLNNAWDSPTLKPQPPSMQQPNRKRTNPFHLGTMLAQENRSVPNPSTRTELKRPVHLHTLESDMQLGREREGSVYLDTHSAPRSGSGAMMRPDSSMTMMSDLTASTQGITVNYTADDDDARDHAYPRVHSKRGYADDVSIHSGRNSDELSHNFEAASPKRATVSATALAEEWGTSDPKLLAMIMKRNKRMKSFQQQKEAREREKSSSERYQKFLRSTANGKYGHSGNNGASGGGAKSGLAGTAVSGSFGGKPKSFRGSGGRGAGRGGRGGRVAMMPPAWMIGETESKDDA
jgi:Leucine-rich repeat (LRR) protein